MRYIITGHSGFVGEYMVKHILKNEPDAIIVGVDVKRSFNTFDHKIIEKTIDLLDEEIVRNIISEIQPDYLIHLASYSSVAFSWEKPVVSFRNNTNIFLNILESVRLFSPGCKILSVGSSEEYGIVTDHEVRLHESLQLNPISPYAVARVAQEQLSQVFSKGYGLNIICTRSFNHVGAGQSDLFVVSSLAKKMVELSLGSHDTLFVGNIAIVRDFLDVRDVVKAYYLLLKSGISGEVYNICSGIGRSIEEIITILASITNTIPKIVVDKSLLRPIENPIVIGSFEKITAATGWKPLIDFRFSLETIVHYWKSKILGGTFPETS